MMIPIFLLGITEHSSFLKTIMITHNKQRNTTTNGNNDKNNQMRVGKPLIEACSQKLK